MVLVRMVKQMSGTRDGQEWPSPGGTIDVDQDEARMLVANGAAENPDGTSTAETAEAKPDGPKRRGRKPAATPGE